MQNSQIHEVVKELKTAVAAWNIPIVTEISRRRRDPFKVLISTVLSLRTKDETTAAASHRLYRLAETPERMLELSERQIAEAIYPVGFYRTKAGNILQICRELVSRFDGRVPDDLETLLGLKGVGRKTANLVLTLGYGKAGICVDTHVHRISNRLGYVKTKTPEQTEFALRKKLPAEYWIIYNDLLVAFGQNLCKPVSPFCSRCPVRIFCSRVGVIHSR
ncbi:MAG: endonuclease III [Candidatus Glassbacteria bacterium]|nr:endonuclease III [Candidatus Glassbacteria bacterium]